MKTRVRTAILSAVLASLAGCAACDSVPDEALESCEASQPVAGRVKTDILFVIDDSGSMSGEQERVRAALARFIQTLSSSPIADDFQIGVTNTSVQDYLNPDGTQPPDFEEYTSGPNAGVPVPYPAGAIVAVDPTNLVSGTPSTYGEYYYTPDPLAPDPGFYGPRILAWDAAFLTTAFENNVLVGTSGAGREQPLRAVQLALTTQLQAGGENVGFLRPGARLAIIFVTDEDDCSGPPDPTITLDSQCRMARASQSSSLLPVADFAAFLQGPIGGEVREVVAAAIVGVSCTGGICTNSLCSGALSTPDRILQVLDALPAYRTRLASICDDNFDQALQDFAVAMMSHTLPLDGEIADYRMLVATVTKAGGGTVACTVAHVDSPAGERNAADAVYEPPRAGRPASVTFQNACALEPGDRVEIQVVCVR